MEFVLIILRVVFILLGAAALVKYVWKASWCNIVADVCSAVCAFAIFSELDSFMKSFSGYASFNGYDNVAGIVASVAPFVFLLPLVRYCIAKKNGQFTMETILLSTAIVVFIDATCHVVGDRVGLIGAIVNTLVIASFAMRSEQRHNTNIAKVNEQMLNAQLNHYESIKQSNFELRRIKHDMKNHLLVARDMAEKGKTQELIDYLDTLTGEVVQSDVFCRTGNDIADAILSDKNNKASKRGITLVVSGDLAGAQIDAVDLCTIIANLLDNAIEAVSKLYNLNPSERHKVIKIDFKKNANFLVIEQSNYAATKMRSEKGRFITSKDSPDHGFGLYNIKQAVKRNSGEFEISSQEGEFIKYNFEIILPLK